MEIVTDTKKYLFQQKFHKKLYQFNRNSQFKSVMQKLSSWAPGVGLRQKSQCCCSESDSASTQKPPTPYV